MVLFFVPMFNSNYGSILRFYRYENGRDKAII